jgi:BA14K-like protein
MGGPRMGAGMQSNFRGPQANVGRSNFAGRGNAQFAQSGDRGVLGGGQFRDSRRGYGRGAGFAVGAAAAGVATGAALAAGDYGYGYSDPYYYGDNYAYDPGYYGDSYAYDTGATYDTGLPLVTFNQPAAVVEQGPVAVAGDASYCAQRYRSYDPASGTYLGFDGLRHPCM